MPPQRPAVSFSGRSININPQNLMSHTKQISGGYTGEFEFNRGIITGSCQLKSNNSGSLSPCRYNGSLNGNSCAVYESGVLIPFFCDKRSLSGFSDYKNPQTGERVKVNWTANATVYEDYDERDRQRQLEAEARQARALEMAANAKSGIAPENLTLAGYMDDIISADARSWVLNRYDRGSVYSVQLVNQSDDGQNADAVAEYTYNGGLRGWVRAHLVGGVVSCFEYHDFSGQCRPVNAASPSGPMLAGLAVSMLSSSASGGYDNYDYSDGEAESRRIQQHNDMIAHSCQATGC